MWPFLRPPILPSTPPVPMILCVYIHTIAATCEGVRKGENEY
jgi:hypothetical protein